MKDGLSALVPVGATVGVCTVVVTGVGKGVGASVWSIDLRYDGSSILSQIHVIHLDHYSKCVISKTNDSSRIFKLSGLPNSSRMLISRFAIRDIGEGLDS